MAVLRRGRCRRRRTCECKRATPPPPVVTPRSGLGDDTCVPPWLYSKPPHYDMAHARKEFEVRMGMGGGCRGEGGSRGRRLPLLPQRGRCARINRRASPRRTPNSPTALSNTRTLKRARVLKHTTPRQPLRTDLLLLRGAGRARPRRRAPAPGRRGHHQLLALQPDAVPVGDDHAPLWDGVAHDQLQPRRHGLLG